VAISGGQGAVVGDYATVFQNFTTAPAALASHVRVRQFRNTIEDRTRSFVGRDFVFAAIDGALRDEEFPSGYVVLQGEPGIGKTAVLAQLIKSRGYVHHLNVAPLGIRSPEAFLANVCAQLILRYGLDHAFLPEDATRDGGFLAGLLADAAAEPGALPIVVVVDALDEAEHPGAAGANRLFLPPSLPAGVFFVVSTREQYDYRLFVDARRDIYLRDDDPQNLADVTAYIDDFLDRNADRIGEPDRIGAAVVEHSEGNFMYVVHVLRDILEGRIDPADIRALPVGLRSYYRRHWAVMRDQDAEFFRRYQEPVICLLATAREPVTLAQVGEWAGQYWTAAGWDASDLQRGRVVEVVRAWQEFLNSEQTGAGTRYRIYHASFQDFLREEIGLADYHTAISSAALAKLPGFAVEP
jgi:hypothetical protein